MEVQSSQIALSKFEGAGNDFLVMFDLEERVSIQPAEVVHLTDRHKGIGSDGFITVTGPSGGADITMTLFNQDGSRAEISGNGLQCVSHAAVRSGVVAPGSFDVMTGAGLRRVTCELMSSSSAVTEASMGCPQIESISELVHEVYVSVGNPHFVRVVDATSEVDLVHEGTQLQNLRPGGINVEFIEILNDSEIRLVVFERGVGPTLACGSGSVAAALAAHALGLTKQEVRIFNPGGVLDVRLADGEAWLSGSTRHIADLVATLERSS